MTEKVSEEVVEAPAKTKGKRVMDVQEADAEVESPAKKSKTEATAKDLDLVKKGKRGGKTSPLSPSKTCRDNGESVEPVQVCILFWYYYSCLVKCSLYIKMENIWVLIPIFVFIKGTFG